MPCQQRVLRVFRSHLAGSSDAMRSSIHWTTSRHSLTASFSVKGAMRRTRGYLGNTPIFWQFVKSALDASFTPVMLGMDLPVRRIHTPIGRHSLPPFLLPAGDRTRTVVTTCSDGSSTSLEKTRMKVIKSEREDGISGGHLRGVFLESQAVLRSVCGKSDRFEKEVLSGFRTSLGPDSCVTHEDRKAAPGSFADPLKDALRHSVHSTETRACLCPRARTNDVHRHRTTTSRTWDTRV